MKIYFQMIKCNLLFAKVHKNIIVMVFFLLFYSLRMGFLLFFNYNNQLIFGVLFQFVCMLFCILGVSLDLLCNDFQYQYLFVLRVYRWILKNVYTNMWCIAVNGRRIMNLSCVCNIL